MRFAFIIDPLESLNPKKDTSLAMMRAAQAGGHEVYIMQQHDLYLSGPKPKMRSQRLVQTDAGYQLSEPKTDGANAFDAVVMRKDPPFDNEYLYSTYLLDLVAQETLVVNDASSVRGWNEKLAITLFSEFTTDFLVTADQTLIKDFLKQHQDIVVKPLDGMGGRGIFRLQQHDPNLGAILETSTQYGRQTIMAQQYIPDIVHGDKRILLIDGEPVPYALARIPQQGETRGNLAAGGTGVVQTLSSRDLEIAETVGFKAKASGHFFVGIDVIGDYLTEVNVTSPTGVVEIANQTASLANPCDPAQRFIIKLVEKIQQASHV